ncbi:MAG: hypothetical protein HKL80_10740 [Acidimicrobiales bacterium]|nr:hypothetical protein [Acidimicrobiales bacterium]
MAEQYLSTKKVDPNWDPLARPHRGFRIFLTVLLLVFFGIVALGFAAISSFGHGLGVAIGESNALPTGLYMASDNDLVVLQMSVFPQVSVLDLKTNQFSAGSPNDFLYPNALAAAVSPDGTDAYYIDSSGNLVTQSIIWNTRSSLQTKGIDLETVEGMGVTADYTTAIIASGNRIYEISLSNGALLAEQNLSLEGSISKFVFDSNSGLGYLLIREGSTSHVVIISAANWQDISNIQVPESTSGVVPIPAENELVTYSTDGRSLSLVNASTGLVIKSAEVPYRISAMAGDGQNLYIVSPEIGQSNLLFYKANTATLLFSQLGSYADNGTGVSFG